MNTTIGERFAQLIEAKKISTNAFANSLGKPYTSIKVIINGSSKPGYDLLERILQTYPEISTAWLMSGDGPMLKSAKTAGEPLPSDDDYLRTHLEKLEEQFSKLIDQLSVKDHQLESKDEQIASLQRMLETTLGKFKGSTNRPVRNPNSRKDLVATA